MLSVSILDSFHYQILGPPTCPRLVFLHGLMGSAANWRKVTSSLQEHYHILIYDQRGHGRSAHPNSGYRPEDYAEDLRAILDELGWDQVYLVGHSMGGRNAMVFAATWPHRVKKLVLEDIGPDANEGAADRIEGLVNLVPTPFSSRKEAAAYMRGEFIQKISKNPSARTLAEFFYSNLEEKNGAVNWRFSKAGVLASLKEGRARERWPQFQSLQMPVLIIRGELSPDLPRPIFDRMLKTNPNAKGVEIKKSGHWVHFDQVDAFIKTLEDFLTSKD